MAKRGRPPKYIAKYTTDDPETALIKKEAEVIEYKKL